MAELMQHVDLLSLTDPLKAQYLSGVKLSLSPHLDQAHWDPPGMLRCHHLKLLLLSIHCCDSARIAIPLKEVLMLSLNSDDLKEELKLEGRSLEFHWPNCEIGFLKKKTRDGKWPTGGSKSMHFQPKFKLPDALP